jgi:flagellar hook-associated protein 3 FlgL
MSAIPGNFSRIPNILLSQSALANLSRTQVSLFGVQTQIATGRAVNRFSDDAVKAAAISVLDGRLEQASQRMRNLDHADSSLTVLDAALGEASDLVLEAKGIASEQVGLGSTASERSQQAQVVNSLLQQLLGISNRKSVAGHVFAGSTPGRPAVQALLGGYRYLGEGSGLLTDLGLGSDIPITIGGNNSIGSTSARMEGSVDLDPGLTGASRLTDLSGARGLGITLGQVEFTFAGGTRTAIDLTGADSVQEVTTRITAAIRDYEQANSVTVLGPGGVSFNGGHLTVDVAPASSGPNPQLQFFDVTNGVTAQDLGLAGTPPFSFAAGSPDGLELAAKLTWQTPITALRGVTGSLGSIKLNNLGQSRVIDLSSAVTLEDVKNLIEGTGVGVRVELNAEKTGLNVVNETAGGTQSGDVH